MYASYPFKHKYQGLGDKQIFSIHLKINHSYD